MGRTAPLAECPCPATRTRGLRVEARRASTHRKRAIFRGAVASAVSSLPEKSDHGGVALLQSTPAPRPRRPLEQSRTLSTSRGDHAGVRRRTTSRRERGRRRSQTCYPRGRQRAQNDLADAAREDASGRSQPVFRRSRGAAGRRDEDRDGWRVGRMLLKYARNAVADERVGGRQIIRRARGCCTAHAVVARLEVD